MFGCGLCGLRGCFSSRDMLTEQLLSGSASGGGERRCLEAMAQGDELAREKLIEHNLRLVAHIAKKYASPKRDSDDLISIGTVGFIKAVSTFNTSKSKTLAAYAARCIENAILSQRKKPAVEVAEQTPFEA